MLRKTILFLALIFIFLLQPIIFPIKNVFAEETCSCNGGSGNTASQCSTSGGAWKCTDKDTRPWWVKLGLDKLLNFQPRAMTGEEYVSKESFVPTENDSGNQGNYSNTHMDYTFRNSPEKLKEQQKGVWFYEVIMKTTATGNDGKEKIKYENDIINQKNTSCPEIKISDIAYYFSTKNEKTLYDPDNPTQLVDYPPEIKDYAISIDPNQKSCYEFAYKNIQAVPKGNFLPDAEWGGGNGKDYYINATTASLQYNGSLKENIPEKYQGKGSGTSLNNNTEENIIKLILDSKRQEITMNFLQMPEEGKELSGIYEWIYDTITLDSGGAGYTKDPTQPDNILRNTARLWLTPQKWQDKSISSTANKIEIPKTAIINNFENTNLSMVYN